MIWRVAIVVGWLVLIGLLESWEAAALSTAAVILAVALIRPMSKDRGNG